MDGSREHPLMTAGLKLGDKYSYRPASSTHPHPSLLGGHRVPPPSRRQRRLEQLDVAHPHGALPLHHNVELDEVRFLAPPQVEGNLVSGPVDRTQYRLLIAFREEFAAIWQAAPHFEKGTALEAFCLEFGSIGQKTLLHGGIFYLEESYRLLLRASVNLPRAVLDPDASLGDRGLVGREDSQYLRRSRRLGPGES
jgi:hypothetical protein